MNSQHQQRCGGWWKNHHGMLLLLLSAVLQAQSQSTATATDHPNLIHSPVTGTRWHYWNNNNMTASVHGRKLDVGDFASLNELLNGATITIPGEFEKEIPSAPVEFLDNMLDSVVNNVLYIRNLQCSNLMLGDVQLGVQQQDPAAAADSSSTSSHTVKLNLINWDWDCQADYRYELLKQDGTLDLFGRGSNAMVDFTILATTTTSSDDTTNNVTSRLDACTANVNLADLDFANDSVLMNLVEFVTQLIRGPIQTALSDVICEELGSLGTVALPNLLTQVTNGLQPYLQPSASETNDPLHQEQMLLASLPTMTTINGHAATADAESSPFLNFQNVSTENDQETASTAGLTRLIWQGLDMLDAWLASSIPREDRYDLGINWALRDMILDEFGALALDMTVASESMLAMIQNTTSTTFVNSNSNNQQRPPAHPGQGRVMLSSHDRLLETKIILDQITLHGLDSMTRLDTLQRMGQHTLQNHLAWQFLQATMDLTMIVEPSELPDSLWMNANPDKRITEHVQIQVGATDVQAALSILLAIYQERLEQVPLGGLMAWDSILSCLVSTLYQGNLISTLHVNVSDISEPSLAGFSSRGLERVFSEVMALFYSMYEPFVIRSIPSYAQTTARGLVNNQWLEFLEGLGGSTTNNNEACPVQKLLPLDQVHHVDFRDLFLPADDAKTQGGTGTQPYGDVVPLLWDLVNDQLLSVDENDPSKRLQLNSLLLDPLTASQSGTRGMLHFPGDLAAFVVNETGTSKSTTAGSSIASEIFGSLFEYLELRLYDAKVQNINTIVAPTSILKTSGSPNVLENKLHFGPVSDGALNASVRVLLGIIGASNPLDKKRKLNTNQENHIMDIRLSASSLRVVADFVANMDAQTLLNFPFKDIANPYCWLATMTGPRMSSNGTILQRDETTNILGLKLDAFVANFHDLDLDMECVNDVCAAGGLGALATLTEIWKRSNVTAHLVERYELMATELMTGNFANKQMARWLNEAPRKCHFNDEQNADPGAFPRVDLPELSPLSIDSLLFSTLVAAQAGFVVLSGGNGTSLLSGIEMSSTSTFTNPPDNKGFIDFTNTSDQVGSLADLFAYLVNLANALLQVNADDGDPNVSYTDAGINGIIKDILNEEGVFELQFHDATIFEQSSVKLLLNSLRVTGLDTITHFNILDAVGPQLLDNTMRMQNLTAQIDIRVASGADYIMSAQPIVLSISALDINASIPVFAAILAVKLDAIELGALVDIGNIFRCFLTTAEDFYIPAVELSVGNLSLVVKGLLPASETAFKMSMLEISEAFGIDIKEFLNSAVHVVVNGILRSYMSSAKCDNVILASSRSRRRTEEVIMPYIDFRDMFLKEAMAREYGATGLSPYGNLFRTLFAFVEDMILDVDPLTNLSSVNQMLIAPFTKALSHQAGVLMVAGSIVDVMSRVQVGGLDADFTFRASDAMIKNLDTMGAPIDLLKPVAGEPYLLNNTASVGMDGERPLRASIRLLLGLEGVGEDMQLRNDLELTMDIHAVTLVVTAMLKVASNEFATFPLGDVFNTDCWLAKLPAPALDKYGFRQAGVDPSASLSDLASSVAKLSLRTSCFECTSPGLHNFTTEGSVDIDEVTKLILDYVFDVLGGQFVQVQIDRALNNAARRCPHSPEYDPTFASPNYAVFEHDIDTASTSFLVMILIVTGILLAVLVAVVLARRYFVRERHRRLLKSLPNRQLYLIQKQQEREEKREIEENAVSTSLFLSSASIPVYVRFLMPFVILGNIGFFLSGHLSLGATVNLYIQLAGQSISIEQFFSFSIAQSTIDIWNAGGKALASFIFIFSGLWPYAKQILSLALWFTPPSRVSMATRGSILLWLDTLAKWSMVDIFVLLVSLAGFRVSVTSPDVDFLPDDFYSVDLMVVPTWGLYANMIAQIISQVSSHVIIHYHRRVVDHATRARHAIFYKTASLMQEDEEDMVEGFFRERSSLSLESENSQDANRVDRLCEHQFVRLHSRNAKLVARRCVNPLLVMLAISMSVLLVVGCALPSYSLEILGIMGVLVESGNRWKQAVEKLSVFDMAKMLVEQAAFLKGAGNYVGLGTLSALLILTVLIVPMTQTIVLVVHWFAPMTRRTRRRMSVVLEGLQAWQNVEVYLIATVVAVWQLGPTSEFMINSYCGKLDKTFDMLVYYGILNDNDAQCFRVEANIESSAYCLAASALLLALLNSYVCNASKQYFRDVDTRSGNEMLVLPTNPLDSNLSTRLSDEVVADITSGPRGSYDKRPGLESRGSSFNDEGVVREEEFLLAVDPLEPQATDKDPLATLAVDGDEADDTWRRSDALEKIHPLPVLFSDKFRWTLCSKDVPVAEATEVSARKTDLAYHDTHHSESVESTLMMDSDVPVLILRVPSSRRDGDNLRNGFEDVALDGDSELIIDEVTKATNPRELDWTMDGEGGSEDTEMGHTHVIDSSVGTTSQSESATASFAQSEGLAALHMAPSRDYSVLFSTDTDDDTFDDEGIPKLRAELADVDRCFSGDSTKELVGRLGCDYDVDRTEPMNIVFDDADFSPQASDTFEDEKEGANSVDDDVRQDTNDEERQILVQVVNQSQPIRFTFQGQGTLESHPRGPQGNRMLQDAFLS